MAHRKVEGTIDTNVADAASAPFSVYKHLCVSVFLYDDSGAHTGHELTLQAAPSEDDDFVDTEHKITALSPLMSVTILADRVRLKVTTVEGAPSSTKYIMLRQ